MTRRGHLSSFGQWLSDPRLTPHQRLAVEEAVAQLDLDEARACYPDLAERLAEAGYADGRVYVRFGRPPGSGRSATYHEEEALESGVSAFAARKTLAGDFVLDGGGALLRSNVVAFARQGRKAYEVRGTPSGAVGTSGEPLLSNVEGYEPMAPEAIVAGAAPSYALEMWNTARGGWVDDRLEERAARTALPDDDAARGDGSA